MAKVEAALVFLLCFLAQTSSSKFETEIINGQLDNYVSKDVNESIQFIIHYQNVTGSGLRVNTISENARDENPVIIVVRQRKGVLSWQIPFFVKHETTSSYDRYFSVNRTLCPLENNPKVLKAEEPSDIFVTVSSSSKENVTFSVLVYRQEVFYISKMGQTFETKVSPSAPMFFSMTLPEDVDSALVKLTSTQRICTIMSIQNNTCPVYDLDLNVQFEGGYQTVDFQGGLTFTRWDYPLGAFLVIVPKTDDFACHNALRLNGDWNEDDAIRSKEVTLSIQEQITRDEYIIATFGALGLFVGAYFVVFMISCVLCMKEYRMGTVDEDRRPIVSTVEVTLAENRLETIPEEEAMENQQRRRHFAQAQEENQDEINHIDVITEEIQAETLSNNSSLDEEDIDFLNDADSEKDIFRTKTMLFLSDLARKSPRVLAKKSSLYNWNLLTIAIFYGLPVVQLVLTYQNVTRSTGNQDICYFNFLCAHPLGLVTDFNHIFSNLGYVMLGILFILIVWRKERRHEKLPLEHRKKFGIPQHFGMYYAMGVALIMEGIMSGCYHVCPNHTNFQFDTAFMYTISILILLKIYQTRHPDINANAYTAFGVLAFIIFIGVIGVLHGNVLFWIFFTALHCTSCFLLSFQIYYMGRWKMNAGIFKRVWLACVNDFKAVLGGNWRGLKPMYPDRFILLVVLNIGNYSLSGYGAGYLSGRGADFASFLLAIFISNVMLYTMFYIIMKLRYKERIGAQPAAYILISTFTWIGSLYFFLHKSSSWIRTPAESRELNQDCKLFHFYDNHDIWHFLSATSLFLSFMILLTLDDDLENIPRDKIPVF